MGGAPRGAAAGGTASSTAGLSGMRIAYISAGAAGMYCGSCLHDNTLARALIRRGHDVALVPLYTPIRTDEEDVSLDRVFYGAVGVYLEQRSALFRRMPRWLDRLLSRPGLLRWVSRRGAATVDAPRLGALTLSVLRGEEGNQRADLERLVAWLRAEFRPEIVHLSNSMMAGLARRIRAELRVPVVCSVQGEDLFLDQLAEPYLAPVHAELRERAADVDGFIATNRSYAEQMAKVLGVPAGRMHRVRLGIDVESFAQSGAAPAERPFVIGYLARLCPEKGLHLLVDAVRSLVERRGADALRLRIAGYLGARDRDYVSGVMRRIREWGLEQVVESCGEVDRRQKIDFLGSLHVLSVPTTYREPKGLFALEALAAGVPVVLPRHGSFPEIVEETGGGVLFEPASAAALARALESLIDDPARRAELGRRGREAVRRVHDDATMAAETERVYALHLARRAAAAGGG